MKREENETVITWTAADEEATVYSTMPKIWKWCERAKGREIRTDEGIREGEKAARTFLVDIGCIRVRPRRKATPAQLEAISHAHAAAKEAKWDIPEDSGS